MTLEHWYTNTVFIDNDLLIESGGGVQNIIPMRALQKKLRMHCINWNISLQPTCAGRSSLLWYSTNNYHIVLIKILAL